MKYSLISIIVAAVTTTIVSSTALADPAGFRQLYIDMPHHKAPAAVSVWYPNVPGGKAEIYAENSVFKGVQGVKDAAVAPGRFPLVLFSHGMGGTSRAQAWLSSALAERGAIVVSVNHPNTTWGDFNMQEGVKHWTRAQDMTAALDALIEHSDFADHIDERRVMAAGFSYGGWIALSLGGMTANHAGTVSACQERPDMEACQLLLSERVNMQGISTDLWNASYSDQRVTHVFSIDPGFVWGLEEANLENLVSNMTLVGLGNGMTRMSATDFDASGLAGLMANAQTRQFVPAFHFTAMPLCKPEAEAMLKSENDDPVCTDPEGTNRAAVHMAIVDMITEQLGL